MGVGYTNSRAPAMRKEVAWREEHAPGIAKDNERIGAYEASLENKRQEMPMKIREAIVTGDISDDFSEEGAVKIAELSEQYRALENEYTAVENTIAYGRSSHEQAEQQKLELDRKLGGILALVDGMAENELNASDIMQKELEEQKAVIDGLRNNGALNPAYWNFGKEMGDEFSKGIQAAIVSNNPFAPPTGLQEYETGVNYGPRKGKDGKFEVSLFNFGGKNNAFSLERVPFDNFPALLHEGERVMTAQEVRQGKDRTTAVNISGNTFKVREQADIYKIARQLADNLAKAQMIS